MSLFLLDLSGGFALLASTGAVLASAPAPGALTLAGVVTGLAPLAAAGALGVLGRKLIELFH